MYLSKDSAPIRFRRNVCTNSLDEFTLALVGRNYKCAYTIYAVYLTLGSTYIDIIDRLVYLTIVWLV